MRFLRTFAVLAALAVAATTVAATTFGPLRAHAQGTGSPEAMQAADELFAILSKDLLSQLTNQVTGAIWPSIERDLRTSRSNIDSATLAELRAEFERLQLSNLTEVMKGAPAIYARYFSASELRDMIAFYRTPTGQKALRVLPQVTGEFLAGITPRLQDLQVKTIEAFNAVLRQRGLSK